MNKYRLSLTKRLETGIILEVFAATPAEAAKIANQAVQRSGEEFRTAEINSSEITAANLLVKVDADFTEATISQVAPPDESELSDVYRLLLTRGYDYMGDDGLLKYEDEAMFMKPLRDEDQNGLNADLRVSAKLNRQTGVFDYFIEGYCYQVVDDNANETDAAPAILHLRDKSDGMTAVELTKLLPQYERKYQEIILLVLSGTEKNHQIPNGATKYGEIRELLKTMSSPKTN